MNNNWSHRELNGYTKEEFKNLYQGKFDPLEDKCTSPSEIFERMPELQIGARTDAMSNHIFECLIRGCDPLKLLDMVLADRRKLIEEYMKHIETGRTLKTY